MTVANILLLITAAKTALMAGLFYAWSCSVMPGLARLSNREFVASMQAMNRAIQNPVFFAAFFGAPLLLPVSAFLHYDESPRFPLLLAAGLIYLTGTFAVTIFGNVPLNNTLDRFKLESAAEEEIVSQRANFERRWTNLNTVRTASSTLSLILVLIALLN